MASWGSEAKGNMPVASLAPGSGGDPCDRLSEVPPLRAGEAGTARFQTSLPE
jgi:hypothetical protein